MNFNVGGAVKGALRNLNLDTKMRGYAVWGVAAFHPLRRAVG